MKIRKNLAGRKFGRWTVLEYSHHRGKVPCWHVRCQCGNKKVVIVTTLYSGASQSCGCLCKEINSARSFKHGHAASITYRSWQKMKARCNPKTKDVKYLKYYVNKGVKVCQRWLDKFENFLADMGERPSKSHSIDRLDNDKGYFKENCVWANIKDQARNKRCCKWVEFRGRLYSIPDLAEKYGLSPATLTARIKHKWDIETAVMRPTQARAKNRPKLKALDTKGE